MDGDKFSIERAVIKQTNKLLRIRGEQIARTETIKALNAGRDEGARQLIDSGNVSARNVTGIWHSAGDGKVRDSHSAIDGQTRLIGEAFQTPSGVLLLHPGDTSLGAPAADTINCRCYKEIKIDYLAEAA